MSDCKHEIVDEVVATMPPIYHCKHCGRETTDGVNWKPCPRYEIKAWLDAQDE